ncbi:hypothetical protein [Candidatus Methylocalor cossyra]|uniref:Lipoprotein n=1 Tax=Candidatus Methylocalor cossyra TaxID=3108543 RepID=A0ABM9NHE0_9GAMM
MRSTSWGIVVALPLLASCTAAVDKDSVRATANAPTSTQVDILRIPYDPGQPRYVVTVEPLTVGTGSGGGVSQAPAPGQRYGWGPFGWGVLLPGQAPTAPGAYTANQAGMSERVVRDHRAADQRPEQRRQRGRGGLRAL